MPARIVEEEGKVYLEKFCELHGFSEVLISSDAGWYCDSLRYVKPKQVPLQVYVKEFRGCPESCGSCSEHQQHTCLPVIEITSRCNLTCPVCLKRFKDSFQLTESSFGKIIDGLIRCEGRVDVVNLSGGEPTLHPRLADFLRMTKAKGVMQATVSTNGLLFLSKPGLRRLFRETGALAALQFDGFRPETYVRLRGKDLSTEKREIIKLMEQEGIRYSLVATVAKGINDNEIRDIADFFFRSKAVSLMLQPIVLTGAAEQFSQAEKLTIPDVVHELEESSYVSRGDFNPLPCSHF
ncbi:MAG TPA: radical SAM protein, partial [Nitrospirota bacterium]|nr:radical SAM protein [Nitrospirota bacterium]